MDYSGDEEALDLSTKDKGEKALADEVMERCIRIVANVNKFKQPRLDRISLYRDLYAGKVKRKYRQPFNVVLPVFSGAMDTLMAAASEALERIAGLYRIESEIRGRNVGERQSIRLKRSRLIIEAFEPWLREKLGLISQKTKLAEAIRYALSRWDGLTRFLDDGRIEIDTNVVERAFRPIALNRKNALFAGSDGGGEHWAIIASLIETCKLGGIDPQIYLADVITRIVKGHPNSRIDDLLPWAYTPSADLKAVA